MTTHTQMFNKFLLFLMDVKQTLLAGELWINIYKMTTIKKNGVHFWKALMFHRFLLCNTNKRLCIFVMVKFMIMFCNV